MGETSCAGTGVPWTRPHANANVQHHSPELSVPIPIVNLTQTTAANLSLTDMKKLTVPCSRTFRRSAPNSVESAKIQQISYLKFNVFTLSSQQDLVLIMFS